MYLLQSDVELKLNLMLMNPAQTDLTSQPARNNLSGSLAPGFLTVSWPPSPKFLATLAPVRVLKQAASKTDVAQTIYSLHLLLPPQIFQLPIN
jgi:hypothetical protein